MHRLGACERITHNPLDIVVLHDRLKQLTEVDIVDTTSLFLKLCKLIECCLQHNWIMQFIMGARSRAVCNVHKLASDHLIEYSGVSVHIVPLPTENFIVRFSFVFFFILPL